MWFNKVNSDETFTEVSNVEEKVFGEEIFEKFLFLKIDENDTT